MLLITHQWQINFFRCSRGSRDGVERMLVRPVSHVVIAEFLRWHESVHKGLHRHRLQSETSRVSKMLHITKQGLVWVESKSDHREVTSHRDIVDAFLWH